MHKYAAYLPILAGLIVSTIALLLTSPVISVESNRVQPSRSRHSIFESSPHLFQLREKPEKKRDGTFFMRTWQPDSYGFQNELPLEYKGGEVICAEEKVYTTGEVELQCVIDVGLGQEKILVIEKFNPSSQHRDSLFFSAEQFNVFAPPAQLSRVITSLQHMGLQVLTNKFGASVLCVQIPEEAANFFETLFMAEQILHGQGEIIFAAPRTAKID